ncbi:spore germination protein [Paenibacillus xylaniclasticus]|uniref:spore germination protein n=1 Tax=Paenibacillus xylaniclasticus TaxID=588083 RepID=UPI000FD93804|nr:MULTISPECIES: spore germination protein [Paenibacillus]GFN30096.1 putative membrane protein YfkQ [Paenibacillus curdlanolyticus]
MTSKAKPSSSQLLKQELEALGRQPLGKELQRSSEQLRQLYAGCSDVIFRSFMIGGNSNALLLFIDGLSDATAIDSSIISPLMKAQSNQAMQLPQLAEQTVTVASSKPVTTYAQVMEAVSNGMPVLLRDQEEGGIAFGLPRWEKRSIEEPSAEPGIRGPREGLTETLRVNTSQLRRIIKSPLLKIEVMTLGEYSRTNVALAYVKGLADETLIEEMKARLNRIQIDGILESGNIEELIEDAAFSPFPQLLNTERPDVVCAALLEGRAAILMEGTPFALVAPITFFTLMQAPEDYYQRFMVSTFVRWLRYVFLLISLLLPSLYVAVLTFHQEMVPGSLLISMASAREQVPFPALIEALMMEVTFEALREAGIRLPKQVGAAVSIVGALVIGQAAVQAGLVSAPMVIVVAITGIASFMIPRYTAGIAVRMLRFPLILLAGTFGLLGVMLGIIAIVMHMSSLRSFGLPYLSALSTFRGRELKDVLVRGPLWMLNERPRLTGEYDAVRQAPNQKPGPQHGSE